MKDYKELANYVRTSGMDFRVYVGKTDIQLAGMFSERETRYTIMVSYNDHTDRHTRIRWDQAILITHQFEPRQALDSFFPYSIEFNYAEAFFPNPQHHHTISPNTIDTLNQAMGDTLFEDFRRAKIGPVCIMPYIDKIGFRSEPNAIIGQCLYDDMKIAVAGLKI